MRSSAKYLSILIAGLMLGACDDGGPETGRLVINLTDAPGDLDEAWVSIREVILIGAEGDESAEGRLVLTPQTTDYVNLLSLTGGNVLELVDATIPTGIYSELRLVIDDAYVVLKDDNRIFATAGATLPAGMTAAGTLRCPSCSSSGFKVKFMDGGLDMQENALVTIDFDVMQSFGHEAGQSGAWVMHPVLRATSTTVQFATVTGTVTLGANVTLPSCGGAPTTLAQFIPIAVAGTDTISGATDAQGVYRIEHLMPGSYTLGHIADITFTTPAETLTLAAAPANGAPVLAAGEVLAVDYTVTAATCN